MVLIISFFKADRTDSTDYLESGVPCSSIIGVLRAPCASSEDTDSTDYLESGVTSIVGGLRGASCGPSEDLTFREEDGENEESTDQGNNIEDNDDLPEGMAKIFNDDPPPTPSCSLHSTPSSNFVCPASTPEQQPEQDISLCSQSML